MYICNNNDFQMYIKKGFYGSDLELFNLLKIQMLNNGNK